MSSKVPRPAAGYETTDATPGMVGLIALSLIVIVGLGLLIAAGTYRHHDRGAATATAPTPQELFQHGVHDGTGIEQAWQEEDRLVHDHLETYGWVDRAGGVVHIPVTRAMELMLAEAAPPKTPAAPNRTTP